jgi:anti-sigma B factor antagonist
MNGWWPQMSGEHFLVLWIGQAAVVSLPAEIDTTNADRVRGTLLSVLNQGATLLIADLSTTTFCDSAGVSALVRTFRRAAAAESQMRLVVGTPPVARILAVTGLDRVLETYPTVSASLAGPDGRPGQGGAAGTSRYCARHLRSRLSPNGGGGCGGSPLTVLTILLAMSRSLTLLCCEADRRISKARAWVQRSLAMTIPSA